MCAHAESFFGPPRTTSWPPLGQPLPAVDQATVDAVIAVLSPARRIVLAIAPAETSITRP